MLAKDDVQDKVRDIVLGLHGFVSREREAASHDETDFTKVSFLNSIIMPDPAVDGESSDDDDEEDEEDAED